MLHPTPEEIAHMQANASDDRRVWFVAANAAFLVLAYLSVAMRVLSRRKIGTHIGLDDWLIIASAFLVTGHAVCLFISVPLGMGRHIIFVTDPKSFAILSLVAQTFYNTCIAVIKISILFLYGRIFQHCVPRFRHVLCGSGIFLTLVMISQCLTYLLRCLPVHSLWTDFGPETTVKCLNFRAAIIAFGIINIVSDWFILFLPIPIVLGLQLERRAKWSICALFLIGVFVCVISIIRLIYSAQVETADVSWHYVPISLISTAELSSGILAACMPTWRPLFKFLRHGISSFLSGGSDNKSGSGSSRSGRWVERARTMTRSKSRSRSKKYNRRSQDEMPKRASTISAGLNRLGVTPPRSESVMSFGSMDGILAQREEVLEMSSSKAVQSAVTSRRGSGVGERPLEGIVVTTTVSSVAKKA